MGSSKRKPVKRYPGVYVRETAKGRVFDICCWHEGRVRREKVGGEWEGYSAKLASIVRAERVRAIHHGDEPPGTRPASPPFKRLGPITSRGSGPTASDPGKMTTDGIVSTSPPGSPRRS